MPRGRKTDDEVEAEDVPEAEAETVEESPVEPPEPEPEPDPVTEVETPPAATAPEAESPAAAAAIVVEAATATLAAAVAEADRVIRSCAGYDGTTLGGVVTSYVLGQLGGVLGVTQRPRRDVRSLVDAVSGLG